MSDTQRLLDEALDEIQSLRQQLADTQRKLEAAEKDAERYKAVRKSYWCDYDDYVNSVGKPECSWTNQNEEEFNLQYDENADNMIEDFSCSIEQSKGGDDGAAIGKQIEGERG